jgi:hypothetical protein
MNSLLKFFRHRGNWPIVFIPLILLIWAQVGAPYLGLLSFNSLSYYNSPYRGNSPYVANLPYREPGEKIVDKVILIVVDALREDSSHEMESLASLREAGASRISVVGQPSFSLPGWTVLGTGAWQEESGFATNFPRGSIDLDTLFLSAKRAGLRTALVGENSWGQLYSVGVDFTIAIPDPGTGLEDHYRNPERAFEFDQELGKHGLDALGENPDFALLYFLGVDTTSHGYGATSSQAKQAQENVDKLIGAYLDQIDLNTTAVFITADHGQVDRNWDGGGGHGGWETVVLNTPLVAAGKGIKPGVYPDARQADIAPTIAVLLGISIPAHNQGDVLFDMIDVPDSFKASRAVDHAEQIAARYQSMLVALGSTTTVDQSNIESARAALNAGDYVSSLESASASNVAVRALWQSAKDAKANQDRIPRFVFALWLLIPMLLYVVWWRRSGWAWKAPLVCGILYVIAWNALFFGRGLTYSITMFNTEERIRQFLSNRVIDTLIVLVIIALVVGIWQHRKSYLETARDMVNTMFVIACAIMLQILVFFVMWGLTYSYVMPDLAQGFKYYMDVFQSTAFWPMLPLPLAAVLPVLAGGAGWLVKLLARGRSSSSG